MFLAVLIVILFLLIGIMLSLGKWSFLIAGFNMMSREEKEQYDEKALCRFMGRFMFVIAFCISLFILSETFNMKILFNIGVILLFVSVIFVVIYSNTCNRFKKHY